MKTKIKMLIVAMIFTLSVVGCKKDYPIPDPPKPQPPAMALSVSEISLMLGMSGEVGLSNVADIRVEGNQDIAVLNYDTTSKKLKIETKAVGVTKLKIIDKADKNRSIELTVKVTPVVFGVWKDAQMILTANYRYQATKSLHMASSGAERKNQFIKIPLKTEWETGETVSITYRKNKDTPEQQITTTISQFRDSSVVYLKTNDGKYIIFPKIKDGE